MGSNIDLRKFQNPDSVEDAFSALVSGKRYGYKTVIERKKPQPKCSQCGRGGEESQKFCPNCGGKMLVPLTNCPSCKKFIEDNEKFCTDCGTKLTAQ